MEDYSVSICIGALNETNSLRKCIETIYKNCEKDDIKEILICICDYTTNDCKQAIKDIQSDYPDFPVKTVYQPPEEKNLGGACRSTFRVAAGTHILAMSSDLECGPEYVSQIIKLSKENPEKLIKGSRWLPNSVFHGYGTLRKAGNKLFQIYMQILFRKNITDYTYSFEAAPAEVFRAIDYRKNGKAAALEMVAEPVKKGIEVKEFPVVWKNREEFAHKKSFFEDFKLLVLYICTSLSIKFTKNK